MNRYLPIWFVACLLVPPDVVSAQRPSVEAPPTQTPESDVEPASSDDEPSERGSAAEVDPNLGPVKRDIVLSVNPSGQQRQVAGYWTSLAVSGTNRTDEDTEQVIIAMVGEDANQQYARRFWMPAGARRAGSLMARVPGNIPLDQVSIPMRSIHLIETERGEEFQTNYLGMPTSSRQLLMSWESFRTGVMLESTDVDYDSGLLVGRMTKFVYAGRDSVGSDSQDLGLVQLDRGFLPETPKALDAFDQIIIGNDSILSDSVAVDHIQSWLASGGRLWVMLDRLKPESVRRLMGDTAPFSILDRIELNEFEHVMPAIFEGAQTNTETWESETTAELVRVMADVEDIQSEINGYPTAFWVPVGQGEILFTALSPNGWVVDDQPTLTYESIAKRFFISRLPDNSQASELTSYLDQQIGYSIPTRQSVASVLGIHMALVLGVGLLLVRRRSLHLLAGIVPIAALVAAGTLIGMGKQKTSSIPTTVAIGQVGRAIPNSNEIRIDSLASVYSQDARALDIQSGHSTVAELVETLTGDVQRIVWDDSGDSKWMFVNQPPGVVRHVSGRSNIQLPTPWRAQGMFNEQGFQGRLIGFDAQSCEDAIVVSSAAPSMAVTVDNASGELSTTNSNVMTPDQYIDSALMSDIQQERQQVLRRLMEAESTTIIDLEPSLLVWSDPVDIDLEFGEGFERRGTLLASIPISLSSQPVGTRFLIPPGFVRLESALGASGFSNVYNERTGQWMGRDSEAEADVRCVLPTSVLPCRLDRMELEIKLNVPLRTVEITTLADGEPVTLFKATGPSGLIREEITDPEKLELDADGGLPLSVKISRTEEEQLIADGKLTDADAQISEDEWKIDYVHITFAGETLSVDGSDN
ncbi:MAG: hypothetical protein AAGG48_22310 [Planctomycetota bacterium]